MTIERRRLRVYVAGPISSNVFEGVHRGFAAGRQLFMDGLAPFVPHSDALFFLPDGNWNAYLEYDLEYIATTEAVYRLQGESKGADLECQKAKELGIPVFYEGFAGGYDALLRFAERQGLRGQRMATDGPVEVMKVAEEAPVYPAAKGTVAEARSYRSGSRAPLIPR